MTAAQQTSIAYVSPRPASPATPGTGSLVVANPDGTNGVPIPVALVGVELPRWSRDATLIAAGGMPVNPGMTPGIFVFDRNGQNLHRVFDLLGGVYAGAIPQQAFSAFSPDGQRLAISYIYTTTSLNSCWAVLVYSVAGTLLATVGGDCVQPSLSTGFSEWGIDWSPTRDLLVGGLLTVKYCVDALGNTYPVIVTDLNAAPPVSNATAMPITNENPCAGVSNPLLLSSTYDVFPVFSQDGTRIAYVQWTQLILGGPINTSIRIINADGTNETVVAAFPGQQSFGVSWSPDGTKLLFDLEQEVNGVAEPQTSSLRMINVDGTGLTQLNVSAGAAEPSWSFVNPPPGIASLDPSTTQAGGPAFTLIVGGSNFGPSSVVRWNGATRPTTFQSAARLQAAILAGDIVQPGTAQVTVSSPAPGGGTSMPLPFTMSPAAATQLAFTVQPASATVGRPITPAVQVTARDASGNTATTFTGNVTVALGVNPGGATLSGTTSTTAVNGVATFANLSVNKVGTAYTLVATASGLTGATSAAFNVTPGAASQLVFSIQPTNTTAGTAITPAVQVSAQDAQGNTVTSFTGSVTVALGTNPGSATLSGTTTAAALNGTASFANLSLNKSGTGYTLTANSGSLMGATSTGFNITPGAANRLVFTGQPSNTATGAAITPAVQVTAQDDQGNTATAFTGTVTVALGMNAGGGTLSGATTATAVSGVAAFPNLSIDKAGTGYTLAASATGLTAGTSAPFTITPAAAPAVTLSTSKLNFDAQLVGTTSAAQGITLSNSGTAPLSITGVSVTKNGAEIGIFAETDNCVGSIAVGASCAVSVTFKATGVGAASGTLTINDNAANTPQTVDLAATGSDYSIATAAGGSTTATVVAGQTATYHLAVQPSGYSGTLSLTCSGAPPAATCSPSPANLDVSATTPAPFTISVGTAARAQTAAGTTRGPRTGTTPTPGLGPLLVVLALLGMLLVRDCLRLPLRARSAAAVTLLLAVALSHCGSGGAPTQPSGGTPAGNYTLVVTGASGGVTRTINLTLRVN